MFNPRIRVVDLETAGTKPWDVCEIAWQDVVLGSDGKWCVDRERGAILVNPGRPISPDMMAIHHIRDEDVAGAPFWKEIAGSVLRPDGGVIALAAHRAAFEQRYCTPTLTGALPGYAPGNQHCGFGRTCLVFRTRCCGIRGCLTASSTSSDCPRTVRCPTPTSLRTTCATCSTKLRANSFCRGAPSPVCFHGYRQGLTAEKTGIRSTTPRCMNWRRIATWTSDSVPRMSCAAGACPVFLPRKS